MTGSLTLMQAVALAGGTAEDANAHRVAVFRQIDGKRQAAAFDLVSIRRGQSEDPSIYAGDIVVIDGSSIKSIAKANFEQHADPVDIPALLTVRPRVRKRRWECNCVATDIALPRGTDADSAVGRMGLSTRNYSGYADEPADSPQITVGLIAADVSRVALADPRRDRAWAGGGNRRDPADQADVPDVGHAGGQSANGRNSRREMQRGVASGPSLWDFVATQVGLLSSRTLAERVAQELNLAARDDIVGTGGDASARLKRATNVVASGLKVEVPESGQLIKYTYTSTSPQLAAEIANGIAENFIGSGMQRRYEASTYARTFLQQQIAKTRRDLERVESAVGRLRPVARHHQHERRQRGR